MFRISFYNHIVPLQKHKFFAKLVICGGIELGSLNKSTQYITSFLP
jgi:hypothetical protein